MLLFGSVFGDGGPDPLILLLVALILDAGIGDPQWIYRFVPHPVRVIGNAIGYLERKLNRERRSEFDRALRGFFAALVVLIGFGIVGTAVAWLGRNHDFGWIVELVLITTLIAQRDLFEHVRRVSRDLEQNGLESARASVSMIVGRDPTRLDEHGVARAAIESCAENYSDGVIAPVFWFVVFGTPGLVVYKAVNTMDSMIGHLTPRYRAFGFAAARLDDGMNWVPARLAGLFLVIAAAIAPATKPWRAVRVMWRDAGKHRSPNAGWPEGAMAGALDLALAGPRHYSERTVNDPWIGDGSARATARDIRRALHLYFIACMINAAWVGMVLIVHHGSGM